MLVAFRLGRHFSVKAYNANKNYYKILKISQSASPIQIKKAYLDMAKKYHPDTNKGKEEEFKQINEAYQVLSSDSTKKEYDMVCKANAYTNNNTSQHPYQQNSNAGSTRNHQRAAENPYTQYYSQRQTPPNSRHSNPYSQDFSHMNARDRAIYEMFMKQKAEFERQNQQYQQYQQERYNRDSAYRAQQEARQDQILRKYAEAMSKRKTDYRSKEEAYKRYEKQYEDYLKNLQKMGKTIKSVNDGVKQAFDFVGLAKELWGLWKKGKDKK